MSFALVDAMAELHLLDPVAAGAADLGKPDGFAARQVAGWTAAMGPRAPDDGPAAHGRAARRLWRRHCPPPTRASIVHNDLKLDNCQFDPADPDRVQSIFDWDMATLGEPLVDLGTLLNYWPDPSDPPGARRVSHEGLLEMDLPDPGRDHRALRRSHRSRRVVGGLVRGLRPVEDRAWWSSSSTTAGCGARAPTPAWRSVAVRLPVLAENAASLLERLEAWGLSALVRSSCVSHRGLRSTR